MVRLYLAWIQAAGTKDHASWPAPTRSAPARLEIGDSFRRCTTPVAPMGAERGWHRWCVEAYLGKSFLRRFDMAAEAEPHRRQYFLGEGVIAAGAEAGEQRRRQHVGGHRLLDRRLDRPAAFAGVLHFAAERCQIPVL